MIDTAYLLTILFIFVRLSAFFILFKVIFPNGTPSAMKLFLSMIIAVSIAGGVEKVNVEIINSNYVFIMYILNEIITGVILGLTTNIIFEILTLAGSWIDVHIGLSMVSMMDANMANMTTVTAKFLQYLAMVIFFVSDAHLLVIKSLIHSVNIVPLGNNIITNESLMALMDVIIEYFFIGIKIALPIVLVIILTDVCMGLISKVVPQINVMILGMPVKMTVGLLLLSISISFIAKIFISTLSNVPSMINKILSLAPIMIIFASEEKTEEATPKKKSDARKKGQIARSKDVGVAITTIAVLLVIITLSDKIVDVFKNNIVYYLQNIDSITISEINLKVISSNVIKAFLSAILPFVLPIMLAGIVGSLMQTGFLLSGEGLKPSFSKLNPINGFKNMFSMRKTFDLIKNLIIVTVVVYIGYSFMTSNYESILQISSLYLPSIGTEVKGLVVSLFTKITILLVVLAAIDYFVQFKFHQKDLRMTKQEIKEEYKQAEGDQQVKAKIKQKQRAMSRQRMMQAVGDATVVITNPTHIAVAIKYEEGKNSAPKLVAKGAENLAIKIKDVARENNVPIIENKPLARLIYKKVEIEHEIPQDMYQAVAEILVVIFKMKGKK